MDDNKKVIGELANDSDRFIASPETIEKLRNLGLPFTDIPAQTLEELFAKRKKSATELVKNLPPLPNGLQPEIQSLYQEIRECVVFGLNGAAITLSAILIEFVLKRTTFTREIGGYQNYDASKWDEFENLELAPAINRAKKAGLLDSEMEEQLQAFRQSIRNPYSHYNIKKITEHVVAEKVTVLNTETGECVERDIKASEDPVIQAQVKPIVDQNQVLAVFHFADKVMKYLLSQIEPQ